MLCKFASQSGQIKKTMADGRAMMQAALVTYVTAGYPTEHETVDILLGMQAGGAGMFLVYINCLQMSNYTARYHRTRSSLHRSNCRRTNDSESQYCMLWLIICWNCPQLTYLVASTHQWRHSNLRPRNCSTGKKERIAGTNFVHGLLQPYSKLWRRSITQGLQGGRRQWFYCG